jgi:hypothetical protein
MKFFSFEECGFSRFSLRRRPSSGTFMCFLDAGNFVWVRGEGSERDFENREENFTPIISF